MKLTNVQAAYFAGMIDGEGSLECQRQMQRRGRTPRYVLRISFTQVTPEPLTTMAVWVGGTVTKYQSRNPKRSDTYRMHIPKSVAVPLLRRCLPFLILKAEQAELILGIESIRNLCSPRECKRGMPMDAVEKMEAMFQKLRATKSNKRAMRHRINQTV